MAIKFLNPYEDDMKEHSKASVLFCDDPSLAQQNFKDETDINVIVKKFGITGQVPVPSRLPNYGDFTGVYDYQTAMNAIIEADNVFNALSADIRKKFDNDPGKFVDFCENPDNIGELRELGLAKPKPVEVVSVPPKEPMQTPPEPVAGGGKAQ